MVRLAIRTHLSERYIRSAAYFARLCWKTEQDRKSEEYGEDLCTSHQSLAIGAISTSVSFLEATINELFSDAADTSITVGYVEQLGKNTRCLMRCLWEIDNYQRTAKLLDKYQDILMLAGKELFKEGQGPYQQAASLIALRNALIHYKPEWIPAHTRGLDQKLVHELERRLKPHFLPNPFISEGQPFFPDKCLGHGCAEWATNVAVRFAEDFFKKMDMTSPLHRIHEKLLTK